MSSRQTFGK